MSTHQERKEISFITQPSIKSSEKPVIIDEDLDVLKRISKNAYDEYFETISDLNSKNSNNNKNKMSSSSVSPGVFPLDSHLFYSEKTFYNNDNKIQEVRRGRFIGKLLHGVSYQDNIENYQQLITEKIKKTSLSSLLPEDMSRRMSKTLEKKQEKLKFLQRNLKRTHEKNVFLKKEEKFKEVIDFVEREIIETRSLLDNLKNSMFYNTKNEENENLPHISLGISSDLIYDKVPKANHENFSFLTESHLKHYINEIHKEKFCLLKIKKITKALEYFPQLIILKLSQDKNQIFEHEILNLIPSKPYCYPQNTQEIIAKCQELTQTFPFHFEFNFDNPTMLFYNVDNFFQEYFQKQNIFLDFSEYILKAQHIIADPKIVQEPDLLLFHSQKNIFKIKKTFWVEDLQFLTEINKKQREQRVAFEDFHNTKLLNWLKFLTMNNLDNMQVRMSRLIRDLREHYNIKNSSEELLFEYFHGYYKLLVIKSRYSIGKLLSYLNFFRMAQKNITNLNKSQFLSTSKEEFLEIHKEKLEQEDKEKRFIEKNLYKLFEKQNKFDKYVYSSPVRPHYGLRNIHEDLEKHTKDLFKVDEQVYVQAMKSEENREPFFRNLDDEFYIDDEEFIIIKDYNQEKVVYDAVLHDFFDLSEEIIKIATFYMHLIEKHKKNRNPQVIFKEEKSPLDREDPFQHDEETLLNEILDLESKFHLEKAKLVMKLLELLNNCLRSKERQELMKIIADISSQRPSFDLTKNTILESYQMEIKNLNLFNEMLDELFKFQTARERETLLQNEKYQEYKQKMDNTPMKEEIPSEKSFMKPKKIIEKNEENIQKEEDFYYLNDSFTEEKQDFCAEIEKKLKKPVYFYLEALVKFINGVHNSQAILQRHIDSCDTTDSLYKLVLDNLQMQQIFFFWGKLKYNFLLFEDLLDYKFLETDPILDKPMGYEIFKREFFKLYYEKADKPYKDTKENLQRKEHSNRILRVSKNMIRIHRAEFLELMFNYIELLRLRDLINIHLFVIAFLMEIYKEQLELFYVTPIYLFQAIGVNSVIDNFNIFKYFISLDKLKCSSEIIDLQNWMFYLITPKRMLEPALLLNAILCLEVLANIGITMNNFYIYEIEKNFTGEELKAKYNGSSHNYFYNIFDKKKRQTYLATTLNTVITKNLERIRMKLKNKKDLKETLTKMNKIDASEKKPKRDLRILEMFCTIMQKEIAFDLMKIQTILIRNQILQFDSKLPFPKKLFEISPLTSPDHKENEKDHDFDLKSIMKKKNPPAFFDEFGYALNIFMIPSIEEIIKIIQLDFDSNQTIEYDEVYIDEDEYKFEEKFLDLKEDSRIPLKKLLEKQRFAPLRKVQRLYQRKKHFLVKGFEYLEKTSLFIMMNVLYSLHKLLRLEYFMNILESHPQDIFYLKMGFLQSERLIIDDNGKIPDLKKNELRIRNDLDGVKFLFKKIQENIQLIKNNSKIINVNEAIMIYLQKIHKKKFNLITMLILNEINIVRKTGDFDFIKKMNYFLQNFAFPNAQFLAKINNQFVFNTDLRNKTHLNPYILSLFDDISDKMTLTKFIFLAPKLKKSKKLNFIYFFNQNNERDDILDLGFIELSKSKRTQLATHLSEILTKTNEIINKRGFYELQNIYRFEKEFNHIIKLNIRFNIFKEVVYIFSKTTFPFQTIDFRKNEDSIEKNLQIFEGKYLKSFDKDYLDKPADEEKIGIILNENRLVFRMEILANEFEKVLLEESVKFYRNFNKIAKQDLSKLSNFQKISIHKAKFINSTLNNFKYFLESVLKSSSEINTLNKGVAIAISFQNFEAYLDVLNKKLYNLVNENFRSLKNSFLNDLNQENSLYFASELTEQNNVFHLKSLIDQIEFKVEAKVSYKSYMLLYQLDYLNIVFSVLKDEASLKEEQVKEAMTTDNGKILTNFELKINDSKGRYTLFKDGMRIDLRKYIENSKELNLKRLRKKVYEIKGGLEMVNLNKQDSETMGFNFPEKKVNILYLFDRFKRFRTFHQVKDVLANEKYEKDLLRLNEKVISIETFFHKIRDLEQKEKGLSEELNENLKKIAFLKKQNLILSKDLTASHLDKKKLEIENSMQSEKINECFTTLEDYKKKKTIEKSGKDSSRSAEEIFYKESFLKKKFEEENKENKTDFIKEDQISVHSMKNTMKKPKSAKVDFKKDLKVNINELPHVIRRKKE